MSLPYKNNSQSGFTLIELLVVIAIIGTLSTVILASLGSARSKARDSARMSDMKEMQKALELAFDENGAYPSQSWVCSNQSGWETGALGTALEPFLPNMPVDPENNGTPGTSAEQSRNDPNYHNYCFYGRNQPSGTPSGSGKWYMITFALEHQNTALDSTDGVTACDDSTFD